MKNPSPLLVVAGATFLALVVFTVPLTTVGEITAVFDLGPAGSAWYLSGMPLGAACGLLAAGAMGDTLGRGRVFTGGLWLTCLASAGAALAPFPLFLILMRVLQGLGSAGIMACGLGLLGQLHEGTERQRATAIWAAALCGGVAAGPLLTSLASGIGGWPTIHWLIAAVSLGLALAARQVLPATMRTGERVDLPGAILLMSGLACLLSALTEARSGPGAGTTVLVAAGLAILLAFVHRERNAANPILRLDLFARPDFTGATVAAFASGAGVLALMSMVPVVLIQARGLDPFMAAIVLTAWSGLTVLTALGAQRIPGDLPPKTTTVFALGGCAAGQLLLLGADTGPVWLFVLPGLALSGVFNGLLNAALGHAALQSVPAERAAMGSAANNTARYLGSALGIALVAVLLGTAGEDGLSARWHLSVLATTLFSLLGAAAILAAGRLGRQEVVGG